MAPAVRANRLTDLEIDEVSSVSADANGYAKILIAKSDDGGNMPNDLFDENGAPVAVSDLQFGQTVYAEDGTEFVYLSPEEAEAAAQEGVELFSLEEGDEGEYEEEREPALAGAVGKSLGQQVLDSLRSATTQGQRDQVVAKAAAQAAQATRENAVLRTQISKMQEDAEIAEWVDVAKSLTAVPVAPEEFGPILYKVSKSLTPEEFEVFGKALQSAEEALYAAYGSDSAAGVNSVHDQVAAMADQVISKSQGSLTPEQAIVALYASNPEFYDAYETN